MNYGEKKNLEERYNRILQILEEEKKQMEALKLEMLKQTNNFESNSKTMVYTYAICLSNIHEEAIRLCKEEMEASSKPVKKQSGGTVGKPRKFKRESIVNTYKYSYNYNFDATLLALNRGDLNNKVISASTLRRILAEAKAQAEKDGLPW